MEEEASTGSLAREAAEAESLRRSDTDVLLGRLAGKSAGEILARISGGDPLRLYARCVERVRERAFVLDPDRLFERALAEVAVELELDFEQHRTVGWPRDAIDRAIRSLLEHDRAAELTGLPPGHPEEHFRLFLECFYVEPPLARLASVRYNALDERVRQSFQKLVIEGRPLDEVLALGLGPPERLQLAIVEALMAGGLLDGDGPPPGTKGARS